MSLLKSDLFRSIRFPILFIFFLFLIKFIEVITDQSWYHYGVFPRTITGLKGILFAPLLHSDFNHLLSNSVSLLVLLSSIFYFYKAVAFRIFAISYLLVGLWVWILGRESYHIGASGLVYAFFGFLVFSGILRKQRSLLTISLLTIFLYGSLVWGILPNDSHISWESHLFGFFTGLIIAYWYKDLSSKNDFENEILNDDTVYKRDYWNDLIEK